MNDVATVDTDSSSDLLPVRMLNEYAYCPRLFHLMHVDGRWADNHYTVEGKHVHRRVDKIDQVLPDADSDDDGEASDVEDDGASTRQRRRTKDDNDEPPDIARSIPLSSDTLGLTAKLDLVSMADGEAVPVETKRGRVPNNELRSYEPERVQLMAQGLLLREHGYVCDHGFLYFAASRTRVEVTFDESLEQRTRQLVAEARAATSRTQLPPPLDDSPKCNGCSLAGICLPDETQAVATLSVSAPSKTEVRRLYPVRDEALPFYVQEQGAVVGKKGESLIVRKSGDQLARVRLKDVSQLVICGNISVTAQTVHVLCEAGIPIVRLSMGHWFYGITHGIGLRNAYDRAEQFKAAADPRKCLAFAKYLVASKGLNQRTMLRRNASAMLQLDRSLDDMADLIKRVDHAESTASLLGLEGNLAGHYFKHFALMFKAAHFETQWDFNGRNRRPPRDPINALLSFGYALLTKSFTVAVSAEGLDPWWGLYHQPRHGRPSLALDLMEPFRPLIVDSAVISAVNTGMVKQRHFQTSSAGCILQPAGRKNFIRAYEARLDQLVTHPTFGYRCSWRSMISLQVRMFARWLRGDVPQMPDIVTR